MNTQFVFDNRLKAFSLTLLGVGLLSMVLRFVTDHTEGNAIFWTNFIQNTVFFTGISFASVLFIATHTLAYGGWQTAFKRIPEAMHFFLPVGALLLLIVWLGIGSFNNVYMWGEHGITDPASDNFDKLVAHKSSLLNKTIYLITIALVLVWFGFGYAMRVRSVAADTQDDKKNNWKLYRQTKAFAAAFLPIAGFSSAFALWLWVMSIDTHWYSTMFAWYSTASVWVSCIAFMILMIIFLKSRGYLPAVTEEHLHDLGKYLFGFSVFWTYLWFSQFMLIWYANNGEETQYFDLRMGKFGIVFYANIIMNFVLPFLILIRNDTKRKVGTMTFVAALVFLGHWIDYFQMVKPFVYYRLSHHHAESHDQHSSTQPEKTYQVLLMNYKEGDKEKGEQQAPQSESTHHDGSTHEAHAQQEATDHTTTDTEHHDDEHHAAGSTSGHGQGHDDHHDSHSSLPFIGFQLPGFLELGMLAGFLGLFLFVFFTMLSKVSLRPGGDPYIDESEHHHVI